MGQLSGTIIPVTPFQQNCAVLWDDGNKQAVVVDPGGDVDRILAAIGEAGVSVERMVDPWSPGPRRRCGGTANGVARHTHRRAGSAR